MKAKMGCNIKCRVTKNEVQFNWYMTLVTFESKKKNNISYASNLKSPAGFISSMIQSAYKENCLQLQTINTVVTLEKQVHKKLNSTHVHHFKYHCMFA